MNELSRLIIEAVEEWKKTGRLPNGQEWRPLFEVSKGASNG